MNKRDPHTSTPLTLRAPAAPPGSSPDPQLASAGPAKAGQKQKKEFLAEDRSRGRSQPLLDGAAPGGLSLQAAPRCAKRVQRGPQGWRPMGTDERKGLSQYQSAQERLDSG